MLTRLGMIASIMALVAASVGCGSKGTSTNAPAWADVTGPPASSQPTVDASRTNNGGKTKNGGTGSLTLSMVSDVNGNGLPNWGDSVTFIVSTTATTEPHVDLTCTQNGVVVYGATTGYYPSYPWPWTQTMTLMSNAWQGGAASCTAKLYYFSGAQNVYLASTSFTANP